jgi:hypothetical protein
LPKESCLAASTPSEVAEEMFEEIEGAAHKWEVENYPS